MKEWIDICMNMLINLVKRIKRILIISTVSPISLLIRPRTTHKWLPWIIIIFSNIIIIFRLYLYIEEKIQQFKWKKNREILRMCGRRCLAALNKFHKIQQNEIEQMRDTVLINIYTCDLDINYYSEPL